MVMLVHLSLDVISAIVAAGLVAVAAIIFRVTIDICNGIDPCQENPGSTKSLASSNMGRDRSGLTARRTVAAGAVFG